MDGQSSEGSGETIFTMEATPLKFGRGSSKEVGWEVKQLRMSRVMLVSDAGVIEAGITPRIQELIEAEGIEIEVWDRSRVEPTADSFQEAADFAKDGGFDGYVAVGGGSSIDTAKVSNLIGTHGGEIMDYINPPIGGGKALLTRHAARGDPDDRRDGLGGDAGRGPGPPRFEGEDRDLAPLPQARPGDRGPEPDREHAA